MALSADALVTWLATKSRLGLADSQQTTVENLINVASARANKWTRRSLMARTATIYLDGTGTDTLPIDNHPVNSITSVHMDKYREFESSSEITDFTADERSLWRWLKWDIGTKNVKVVGNFGYATTPDDLAESIYLLVQYWLDSPNVAWASAQENVQGGGYQVNYVGIGDIPYHVRLIWDMYREVRLG